MGKSAKYDASSITVHSTVSGIRANASMYISFTDARGVLHIAKEAIDNSVDEFLAGRNKFIHVVVEKGRVFIIDEGGGIPIEKVVHPETKKKMPALEAVLTTLHTGGKSRNKSAKAKASDAYKGGTIGTHGVGLKATNALSSKFRVTTRRKGAWYTICFARGKKVEAVHKVRSVPDAPKGIKLKPKGTIIEVHADPKIFTKGTQINMKELARMCQLYSYINGGLKVQVTAGKKTKVWYHPKGLHEYLDRKIKRAKVGAHKRKFVMQHPNFNVAIAFTDAEGNNIEAFTNSSYNKDGGVHLSKFVDSLYDVLNKHKKKKQKFHKADVTEGLMGIINARVESPEFSSQTKGELVDIRVEKLADKLFHKELEGFFASNKKLARELVDRFSNIRALKKEFTENKKALAKVASKGKKKGQLPTKLAPARRCKVHEREIFLVEGDSAGGSAKQARDRRYQEILPLRGKILNSVRKTPAQVLSSNEVVNILQSIGYDPKAKDILASLRMHRIVLLADPDPDGLHINSLISTLFAQYLPEVIDAGYVYIAKVPKYVLKHKGKLYQGSSIYDLKKHCPKGADLGKATHVKGLGELNPNDLAEVALNPETRVLEQVQPLTESVLEEFRLIMSEDTEYRKKMLGYEE